jgi:flagellar biosynthetic protein FliR
MSLEWLLQSVPVFVLVFFRLAGLMLAAPFFGGARIPRRVKLMFALVLAAGLLPGIAAPAALPATTWQLAVGIAGELLFGMAIGTALSFVFVAVHWAGEIIGQQMGLGLGQLFDPQLGQTGAPVADLYYLFTLVTFLLMQGHHAFLRGVRATFDSLPLLSVGMSQGLLDLVTGLLHAATALAIQLAAPMLIAMLLVDVVMGFLSKTMPQINIMTAGLSVRVLCGMVVLILGLMISSEVISQGIVDSVQQIGRACQGLLPSGGTM